MLRGSQAGAYLVIFALIGLFFGLLAPMVAPDVLRIAFQASYAAATAGTIIFVVAATCVFVAQPTSWLQQHINS